MGNQVSYNTANLPPSFAFDRPRGYSMDSVDSTLSSSTDTSGSIFSSSGSKRGTSLPAVSAAFEDVCTTLMRSPFEATEVLENWSLAYGPEYTPLVATAAAHVLAMHGAVRDPTAWEQLRAFGLQEHGHLACAVGGGLLHRIATLRRSGAGEVARLLRLCGCSPCQVAYTPPPTVVPHDTRPLDVGRAAAQTQGGSSDVSAAALDPAFAMCPLSLAARWGHPEGVRALLVADSDLLPRSQRPAAQTQGTHEGSHLQAGAKPPHSSAIKPSCTQSTLRFPVTADIAVVITPALSRVRLASTCDLPPGTPCALVRQSAPDDDALHHALLSAVLGGNAKCLSLLLQHAGPHVLARPCPPDALRGLALDVCPLGKSGSTPRAPLHHVPGNMPSPTSVLPPRHRSLVGLAEFLAEAGSAGHLQCTALLAGAGAPVSPALLTHLKARHRGTALFRAVHENLAWCRRRQLVLLRARSRAAE
ncbi:unnamed protein product [Symbiodinium sp. KB8]|nr:unnamed protein product [Symbiodinium sp. KB8]